MLPSIFLIPDFCPKIFLFFFASLSSPLCRAEVDLRILYRTHYALPRFHHLGTLTYFRHLDLRPRVQVAHHGFF
ncbi:hypothetical protein GGS24DRAFT_481103 [Hypoxylon argillaceum]|nr:hypothetical protein GGS24DRAFT_481103 [Hypoxylon argillaceum]